MVTKSKLSVVIANYNKEQYLEQCLNSVIGQTLENIEIIVVDDGSTDNSSEILKRYEKQYKYIKVYTQENAGVSAARNTGLKYAQGEYITFLDADDYVNPMAYEQLYKLVIKENADIGIANIECFNEYKNWPLSYMKKIFLKRLPTVRHIATHPELHLTPSASNKIFKRELCRQYNISFDEGLQAGEDLLFTQHCLLVANRIVVKDISLLNYRVIDSGDNLSRKTTISFFQQLVALQKKLENLYEIHQKKSYIQFIEKRQWKFFVDSIILKGASFSKEQISEVIQLGNEFLSILCGLDATEDLDVRDQLVTEIIMEHDSIALEKFLIIIQDDSISKEMICEDKQYYHYFYRFFPQYKTFLQVRNLVLNHRIEGIKLRQSVLSISGYAFIENMSTKRIQKELVFRRKGSTKTIQLSNSLRTDVTYLFSNNTIDYNDAGFETVEINISDWLEEGEWKISIRLIKGNTVVEEPMKVLLAQLRNNTKHLISNLFEIRMLYKNSEAAICIRKCNYMQKAMSKYREIKRAMRYDVGLCKRKHYAAFFAIVAYKLFGFYFRKKKIWLIGEREDTAQDNSYHLFTYLRKKHPEIPIFYVIDKECNDYKNVKELGNIIQFGSFKHTFYLLNCNKTINSYSETANMYTDAYKHILKYYPEWQRNEKIFIQHGVIGVSRVNHVLNKNRMGYSLFVVSSQFEKDHIVKEYGYAEDEVIVTGLARWDALQDESKGNEILLMPTWRSWIKTKEQLEESHYWQTYMEFLHSGELHRILEEQDLTLTFFPHYQTQRFGAETPVFHERIKLIKQGEETVQNLLKRHRLLITDYSTVSFDFAYMNKPVIFYQFDYDEFYSSHYNEGPIDHKKALFGPVVMDLDSVLQNILQQSKGQYSHCSFQSNREKYLTKGTRSHCETIIENIFRTR
ncbi:glycosyltransferase [Paenibacillus sp. MER TA 81-3]|nr:glycosyltransferase [Paenibacillus sp. MER TA 81-3]